MIPLTPSREISVWLAVGQSNVVGTAKPAVNLTSREMDDQIMFWDYSGTFTSITGDSGGWSNFADHAGGFGPERGFARRWAWSVNRKIAIIKVAFNGLGLHRFIKGSTEYEELEAQVDEALAALRVTGYVVTVEGLICLGHTNNANVGTSQAQYEDWLADQSEQYSTRWGNSEAKWKIALADHPASWSKYDATGAPAIRAAIAAFAAANPTRVVVVSTADTTDVGDEVHYTSESKELVGLRMAKAIEDLI